MMITNSSTIRRTLAALVAGFMLSGCISYKSETNALSQAIVEDSVLREIELGKTTTDWLLEKFGAPQAVRRPAHSISVWQYENVLSSKKSMRALPLIAITLEDSVATVYNFEVENNFVVKYWKDN